MEGSVMKKKEIIKFVLDAVLMLEDNNPQEAKQMLNFILNNDKQEKQRKKLKK